MLRDRLISALVLATGLLAVVVIGEPAIAIAVLVVVAVGARETFALLRGAGWAAQQVPGVALALLAAVAAAAPPELGSTGAILPAIGLAAVGVTAFRVPDPRQGMAAWVATAFGGLYVAQLGFVIRLGASVPPLPASAPWIALTGARGWILLLILGVWAYDTGAYLVGRTWGRARFLVHLSPSKTYAGLAGGLVACTAVVALMLWGLGQSPVQALLLGPLIGLAAQAGDLAESMLKRAAGAKDSGHVIPGHGGVLDRIDSFLFAAPVVTLYAVALVH